MSDILIKGMEMPKDGFITITVTSDGRVVGNSKKESGKFEYLSNEDIAKAVPIPPHSRSIDADALIAWFKEWYDLNADVEVWQMIQMLADEQVAPTIIPAEEGET